MITMTSRRSKFEIYIDILTEIKNGKAIPTHIMYGANLSWTRLKHTLETFTAKGLVDEQTRTGKGDNVLNYFNKVKELLDPEAAVEIPV